MNKGIQIINHDGLDKMGLHDFIDGFCRVLKSFQFPNKIDSITLEFKPYCCIPGTTIKGFDRGIENNAVEIHITAYFPDRSEKGSLFRILVEKRQPKNSNQLRVYFVHAIRTYNVMLIGFAGEMHSVILEEWVKELTDFFPQLKDQEVRELVETEA